MTSVQSCSVRSKLSQDSHFDSLIVFAPPTIVLPIFSVEMPAVLFEGNAHIVPMPAWSSFVGVSKFLIAFVIMGLTAAAAAIWGTFSAFGWTLFICVSTLFIGGYYRLALGYKPLLYNRWAVLGLEAFGVIFWLTSLILLAEWTATYNDSVFWGKTYLAYLPYDTVNEQKRALLMRTSAEQYHAGVILAGIATGLSAVEFVLFLTTLIVFSINLRKHRQAGYPAVYGGPQTSPVVTTTEAFDEREKARENAQP